MDFLVVAVPADVGGWFAAPRGAGEGDQLPLQGRSGEAGDLWSSWHSCCGQTDQSSYICQ